MRKRAACSGTLGINMHENLYAFHDKLAIYPNTVLNKNCVIYLALGNKFGATTDFEHGDNVGTSRTQVENFVITASYCNIDALTAEKKAAIEIETMADRDFMGSELNLTENDCHILKKQ